MQHNETSADSTSDDSKREIEMALDTVSELRVTIRAGTSDA